MDFTTDDITYWMNVAGSRPVLSQEEIDSIAKIIQSEPVGSKKYKDHVNKLTEHNLRLVIRFVKIFIKAKTKRNWDEIETVDYLQIGTMGLIRAAEKYDPTRGYKFSTYATYWIRSFVTRHSIKASSIFSIPEEACRKAYFFRTHGFLKTKDGIKDEANINKGKQLNDLVSAAQSAVSLYVSVTDDHEHALIDIIASPEFDKGYHLDGKFDPEMEDAIKAAKLSPDQVFILRSLFIYDHKATEIANLRGLSRGQYQSLRKDAMTKLKSVLSPV